MKMDLLNGKTILVTGGTGSFGKKFIQIVLAQAKPKRLIIFSRDELKQFEMAQKWSPAKYPCLSYVLGDVRRPGKYHMNSETISVKEAIIMAGLPSRTAG